MTGEPIDNSSRGRRKGGIGLILAVIFALFVIWMIYTSAQTQSVTSNQNMPGMSQTNQSTPATNMPQNMPGM